MARKSYLKISLNVLSVLIVIAIVLAIIITIFGKTYSYKLDLPKVTFYSDENIIEKLNLLKDSNTIVIVYDNANKDYDLGSSLLYIQIFASQHKRYFFFVYDNKVNQCGYSDSNDSKLITTTFADCDSVLGNFDYPIIKLGEIKDNDKTNVIIEKNIFNIYPTSTKTAYEENHNFLEIIYPNIIDIEQAIQKYVGKVSDIINQNQK